MPYTITQAEDGRWYVYKQDESGKPAGKPHNLKGYKSKKDALPLMRALYAAEHQHTTREAVDGKPVTVPVSELDLTLLSPDATGFDPVFPQAYVHYTPDSPYLAENVRCGSCVFFSGGAYCYLVSQFPQPIVADGWCDKWTEVEALADPAGVHEMSGTIHEIARDLPIAQGDPPWDAGAARERIWKWATNPQGELDVSKAAQAFLIWDGDTKGDLKDPIADVMDGKLVVIPAALRAASSRLPQTEGGKEGAAAALAHYKKKAHIGEFERAALEDFVIMEYKGSVPEVPDAPGIDKQALVADDASPTFVIRPIAQVGRVSKNGILYDQALVDSIREQIITRHPGGIFGHIKEEDRSTAHPQPQAYWIGAKQYGDKLYAKAYIADPERAADIRRKKALGSADGTSIYGPGDKVAGKDGAFLLRNFTLESLDFAPVDRASLDMGREMYISSEMTADDLLLVPTKYSSNEAEPDPNDPQEDKEQEMGDVIDPMVGMTANWKSMTPEAVCEQMTTALGAEMMGKVAEAHLAKQKLKAVASEMEAVPASVVAEMDAQRKTIAELREFKEAAERRELDGAIVREIAAVTPYHPAPEDAAKQKALTETRTVLEMSVRARLGDAPDASAVAETVRAVAVEMPTVLEMLRDRMMGPSATVVGVDNRALDASRYYNRSVDVNDPKFQDEARKRVGV